MKVVQNGGPTVGVRGDFVSLDFGTETRVRFVCDVVSARKLAARINAMADVIDPERRARYPEDMPPDAATKP